MSDLKLAVGQVWLCRDGVNKVTIVRRDDGTLNYPWVGNDGTNDITFTDAGRVLRVHIDNLDLVKLISPIDLTEQTIETFAAITRDGGKVPDGMKRQCRSKVIDEPFVDVMELDIFHTCLHYRLVPIEPPKPEMVPLDNTDVFAGKTLFRTKYGESLVLTVSSDGVSYAIPCFEPTSTPETATLKPLATAETTDSLTLIERVTWKKLKDQAEYSNDHGQTWQRCEKVKP